MDTGKAGRKDMQYTYFDTYCQRKFRCSHLLAEDSTVQTSLDRFLRGYINTSGFGPRYAPVRCAPFVFWDSLPRALRVPLHRSFAAPTFISLTGYYEETWQKLSPSSKKALVDDDFRIRTFTHVPNRWTYNKFWTKNFGYFFNCYNLLWRTVNVQMTIPDLKLQYSRTFFRRLSDLRTHQQYMKTDSIQIVYMDCQTTKIDRQVL